MIKKRRTLWRGRQKEEHREGNKTEGVKS